MRDFQSKLKRQVELLGLSLPGHCLQGKRLNEIAYLYDVEELTIKRDLQELRAFGLSIHTTKKNGITLTDGLSGPKLHKLIVSYLEASHTDHVLDKTTSLMLGKLGLDALGFVTSLQWCIDRRLKALIEYEKEARLTNHHEIEPLLIFQSEGHWRVLTQHDGLSKQYLLDKIRSIKITDKNFDRVSDEVLEGLFQYSWRSWIGADRYNIKLKFRGSWAKRLSVMTFTPNQKMTPLEDGSILFEATVNSLEEVASWTVSRGSDVIALEPVELKNKVLALAQGALDNYK